MRRGAVLCLVAVAAVVAALWWRPWAPLPPPPPADAASSAGGAAAEVGGSGAAAAAADAVARDDARGDAASREALPGNDAFAALRTGYRGRVVSHAGVPVAGIGVRLFRGAPDVALLAGIDVFAAEPAAPELLAASATTRSDGRFDLHGVLPRGICWIRLAFDDVQRAPAALRAGQGTIVPVQRTPAPAEVVDLGDLALKAGAVLMGRVVDEEGHPVAGAIVRAANLPPLPFAVAPIERLSPDDAIVVTAAGRRGVFPLPEWCERIYEALPIARTASEQDGTFVLYGVDAGRAVLAINAAARGSLLRQGLAVEAGATLRLGDLALPDGATAEVRVAASDGKPVADAEVIVAPQSAAVPVHLGERAGRTDAEGKLTVPGLPRGRAMAAARRSDREPWVLGEPGPADGPLFVTLPARYRLTLTVLDASGHAARDVRLQLVDGDEQGGAFELAMFGSQRGVDLARRRRTLEDGRLQIDDLAAGSWWLCATAAQCGVTSLHFQLHADTDRTVQLRPARSLRVRVVDAAGAPVASAALFVQPRGGTRSERIVELPLHQGETDRDGRCTLRDLPTAETRVTASHPLYGQVHATVQDLPAELELRFEASAAIAGRLTDGGRAPAPGRWLVVLERRPAEGAPRGAVPEMPQLQLPDLDGNFTFAALQPGRYRVTAQDSVTDVATVGGLWDYLARRKKIYPWNKADVELRPGESQQVRLDAMIDAAPFTGPGAAVRGIVTIDGVPGDGALVVGTTTPGDRRVTSRVDRGGAFDLGHCPAGALRVVVVPREVAESRLLEHLFSHHFARNVTVVDGNALELVIEIATGGVSGEVRDWNGAPVDDCRVVLFDRGGAGRSSALRVEHTDGRGAFRFAQVPSGTYEVRAHKAGFGKVDIGGVAVVAGAESGSLAVTLLPTARVQGRVDGATGPHHLQLHPFAGGETVHGGAQRDGAFALDDVPVGRYRVTVQSAGGGPRGAGELDVVAPATTGVVLVPAPR